MDRREPVSGVRTRTSALIHNRLDALSADVFDAVSRLSRPTSMPRTCSPRREVAVLAQGSTTASNAAR